MFVIGIVFLIGSASDVGDMRTVGEVFRQFLLSISILTIRTPLMLRSLPKGFFEQ